MKKLGGATLRLKGRLFDDRFDYNVKVLSRVEKARESEETRLELLAELEKEMDEAFQKRAAYNRIKYKTNDAVGKRGRTSLREKNTNELIDRVISILDIKGMIEIPKLSDHMAHWEREQAYKAIQHTIALIKSKELANPLTLQQNIEAFQKVMAMIEEFLYGSDYKPLRDCSRAFEDRTEKINGRISGANQELAGKIRTTRTGPDEVRTTGRESHATTEQVVRVLGRLRASFGQVFEIPTEEGGVDGRTVEATERKTRNFELRNQDLKMLLGSLLELLGEK
ncbi:hypothetical protein [Photobacterium sp. J15]|uniref:hypothetical protein n=1 Tax=Photobacterium sp. J15 TaxID=265901 RepID=UPI0007E2EEEF|nr:hypothetical protein [Photobacterium sp. J15]